MGSWVRFRQRPGLQSEVPRGRSVVFAANERKGQRWPVEQPMEGWLQWEGRVLPAIPVEIANFSAGGVAVWAPPQLDLSPGGHGVLITQAHGRGCGYRPVKGCWQVRGASRSMVGLAFER
jgi:hypothetical protein